MGTRGFIGYVIDGTEKIAYNHWDSYPSGLGKDTLEWLYAATHDMDMLRRDVKNLRVVDADSTPTAEDVERLMQYADLNVGNQSLNDWYSLLRNTQGNPEEMLAAGVIEDAGEFPLDSLFAEWGYLVNLDQGDAGTFEVYKGFQGGAHTLGRFADRPSPHEDYATKAPQSYEEKGWWPVALVATWPLNELPDVEEFLKLDEDEGE